MQTGRKWEKAAQDSFKEHLTLGVKKFRHHAAFGLLVPASCLGPWLPALLMPYAIRRALTAAPSSTEELRPRGRARVCVWIAV